MSDDTGADPASDRPADRSLTWMPLLAAAVIAVLVGAVIFFVGAGEDNQVGTKTDSAGALVCPETYTVRKGRAESPPKAWVPVNPSGVAGKAALAPDAEPSHVTVCQYPAGDSGTSAANSASLAGNVTLTSGLRRATRLLHAQTKASGTPSCADPASDNYLVGMTFATGVLWVSVPADPCVRASNGQFATAGRLNGVTARAFDSRDWPAS